MADWTVMSELSAFLFIGDYHERLQIALKKAWICAGRERERGNKRTDPCPFACLLRRIQLACKPGNDTAGVPFWPVPVVDPVYREKQRCTSASDPDAFETTKRETRRTIPR